MIPSERLRGRPRETSVPRAVTWALLIALGGACTAPVAPDGPVPSGEQPVDDAAGVAEEADPAATPMVPSLGTAADGLDATVVLFEPDGDDEDDREVRVDARVADDTAARARGLMGVEDLPDGAGMLFVYPAEQTGAFWMKDTLVPLDIAFVGADGSVRAVLTMEPCTEDPCPVYDPQVEYLAALEVPAGWFATSDIGVGARVSWTDPVPSDPVPSDPVGQ